MTAAGTPRRPGRPPAREQTGRAQLLDAGLELFSAQGLAATTVEQLCSKAGVSSPALYHHFGTKTDLFVAVADAAYRRILDRYLEELDTATTFGEALEKILDVGVEVLASETRLPGMIMHVTIEVARNQEIADRLYDNRRGFMRCFERVAALAPPEMRPSKTHERELARALVVQIHGMNMSTFIRPEPADNARLVAALKVLLAHSIPMTGSG